MTFAGTSMLAGVVGTLMLAGVAAGALLVPLYKRQVTDTATAEADL
jgi:hypothetical protein